MGGLFSCPLAGNANAKTFVLLFSLFVKRRSILFIKN